MVETVGTGPQDREPPGLVPPIVTPSRSLTPDQLRRLLQVHVDVALGVPGRDPFGEIVQRVAHAISAKVAFVDRRGGVWSLGPESAPEPAFRITAAASVLLDRVAEAPFAARAESWLTGGHAWTLVGCAARPAVVLVIEGDWTKAAAALALLTRNLALVRQAHVSETRAERRRASHQLARALARVRGPHAVWNAIVRRMADAVGARMAALAVPDGFDRHLQIVSTFGYPFDLVEHVRIDPGSGVAGSVFQSGRTLHVTGSHALPAGHRRRPRYSTDSFIAMPLGTAREPLGVVCVTDRRDGRPFTRDDVSTLRALGVPAALALGRERALAQAESYAHAAAIDPLSGAFNRRYFHARLDEELQRSQRHRQSLSLLMIDIDDFKSINDSFGHLAGDTVIRDIAEILRRSVRIFDVCARFGGEEFAIIMPGSTVESASKVASRIRERIEAYRAFDRALDAMRVTVSVGLAESSIGMTGVELIARSDYALYRAKRGGKNRVHTLAPHEPMPRTPPLGS